jgi:hypothetical protein
VKLKQLVPALVPNLADTPGRTNDVRKEQRGQDAVGLG